MKRRGLSKDLKQVRKFTEQMPGRGAPQAQEGHRQAWSNEEGAEVSGTRSRVGLEAAVGGDGGVWTWGVGSEQGCEFGVVGTVGGLRQGEVTKRNEK